MNRFDLFKKMGNNLWGFATDAMFGPTAKDKGSTLFLLVLFLICLAALIALLFAGAEVVYLLTRNKFGTQGVKRGRVFLGSLSFMALAYFCYKSYTDYYGDVMDWGSEVSYLYATISLFIVGLIVLVRGLTVGGKDDSDVIDPIYRGNSWLLGGLVKEGIKQSTVQDLAEPVLFLAIGFCLFSYNYIWGLPFMFCAISSWFHFAVEAGFGFVNERRELSNKGRVYTQNRTMSKVIS